MNDCRDISELLPEYISGRTSKEQDMDIIRHIASCPECRADLILWITAERSLKQTEEESPAEIARTMFDKIPARKTELERIIGSGSYTMAFDLIRYTFKTVKTTLRLASLI